MAEKNDGNVLNIVHEVEKDEGDMPDIVYGLYGPSEIDLTVTASNAGPERSPEEQRLDAVYEPLGVTYISFPAGQDIAICLGDEEVLRLTMDDLEMVKELLGKNTDEQGSEQDSKRGEDDGKDEGAVNRGAGT